MKAIKTLIVAVVCVCALFSISGAFAAGISSTFDTDNEGWTENGAKSLVWESLLGNPPGCISAYDDPGASGWWYYNAPAKFLGDLSGYFDGTIAFDLKTKNTANQSYRPLKITGNGSTIYCDITNPSKTSWTTYTCSLNTGGGWLKNSGVYATNTEIQNVLGNVTEIAILGDWVYGTGSTDTTYLDNVKLTAVPEPSGLMVVLTTGILPLFLRRRK